VFCYLYEKYDNSLSTNLSHFKISLCKIESIEFFPSPINVGFLVLDNKRDTNFFMLKTEIVF
jgi:hypothetical protein